MKKRKFEKEFSLINLNQSTRMKNKKTMIDLFSVNLFYFQEYNTIILPGGILYDPIFNLKNPSYLNYATVGSYLSHEIWHLIEKIIFDNIPTEEFYTHPYIQHLHCLKSSYQTYVSHKYEDIQIGFTSVEEQIADYFGVVNSLVAYTKTLVENPEEESNFLLPRFKYNQKQMFLIRYAESYCRKKHIDEIMFHGVHPIHDYRSFQASLIPEFNKLFNCRSMNKYSIKNCQIFEL